MKLSKCKYRKHSLSEKLEIVRLYETGMSSISLGKRFAIDERAVRRLLATYRTLGVSGLQKQTPNSVSVDFKQKIVSEILEKSLPFDQVVLRYGVSRSAVRSWVCKVKADGYASLAEIKKRGRPPKDMGRPTKKEPVTEFEKLQDELRYLRAENAYLKKLKALVEHRVARESGNKPKSSKD